MSGMLAKGQPRWKRLAGQVLPVQGDSERLPFATGSFDFVTCTNSFHHYPRQNRAVVEMHRVLRPGGRLLIIDGYRDAHGVGSSTMFASRFARATFITPRPGGFATCSHAPGSKPSPRRCIVARLPSCSVKGSRPSRSPPSPHLIFEFATRSKRDRRLTVRACHGTNGSAARLASQEVGITVPRSLPLSTLLVSENWVPWMVRFPIAPAN